MGKSPKETGGPIVKTGPTAGEVRSRNKDGTWHKKRSDSGKPRKPKDDEDQKDSKFCFLTTAACLHKGLPDHCSELEILRSFRDTVLMSTDEGRKLVEHYYSVAPLIVPLLKDEHLEYVWSQIRFCIDDLKLNQNQKAIETYMSMVIHLEKCLLEKTEI